MIGKTIQELSILRQIGEGGMGAVYLAEDRLLRTKHVVKVLLPRWTQDASIVDRFVNEARATAAIRSKNIVSVQRCFQHEGQWMIVMEYLEGQTLARFVEARGPLPQQIVVEIASGIAAGLAAAHARGIVHRDLKPENIFVTTDEDGRRLVKVLDFGIAKLGEIGRGATTRTGMMAGTPAYMAPEQMRDFRSVDARADIYALGVIAFQLATGGQLPFQDSESAEQYYELSAIEIYERQRARSPVDPRLRAPILADQFVDVIFGALQFDPARRPRTVQHLVLALAEATPGDGYSPSGVEIVGRVSKRLLETDSLLETIRATGGAPQLPQQYPAIEIPIAAVAPPEVVTRAERPQPPTTLGSAASQVPIPSARSRWGIALALATIVMITISAGALLVKRVPARRAADATVDASPRPIAPPQSIPATRTPPADASVDAPIPTIIVAPAQTPIDAGTQIDAPHHARPTRQEIGELEVLVRPWATVSVDGRPLGQTPVHEKLPAGRHRVRIANDVTGKDETITVIVDPDRKATIRRSW